ncbi:MAG: DUF2726 domain-containing protein [Desulfobulbaceae bacterium]|nr:DUF2726 domain-containing protein [Desulfobulbaceae bacterium]
MEGLGGLIFLLIILGVISQMLTQKDKHKNRGGQKRGQKIKRSSIDWTDNANLPYRLRDDFLSVAEFKFFQYLKEASCDVAVICPKVSLQDIFFVSDGDQQTKWGLWQKINKKHVDFLLCCPEKMTPLMGVELDDRSHLRPDRIERDEFVNNLFDTAELPLLRFQVKKSYNSVQIKKAIIEALGVLTPPDCPKCNIPLALKVNYNDKLFWGCGNYPKCKSSKDFNVVTLNEKQMENVIEKESAKSTVIDIPIRTDPKAKIVDYYQ